MNDITRLASTVLQPGFDGISLPDWLRRALGAGLGGVLLWDRNVATPAQVTGLTAAVHAENPHALVAVDEEGGDVTRLESTTGSSWPSHAALGVVDDVGLTRAVAGGIGRDLSAGGIDLNYAPVADVNSNPDNPVIGVRSFGADPHLVAAHTAAFVAGMQAWGVAACAKHFPGHGDTSVDSHRGLPVVDADTDALAAGALVPFRAAIAAGVRAVMSAHIVLPALDSVPATLSRRVLTGLLREELGFDGLVVTDAVEMAAIKKTYGLAEGAVRALAAGADVVCIGGWRDAQTTLTRLTEAIEAAVRNGRLTEDRLAEAARRVRQVAEWTARGRTSGPSAGRDDRAAGLAAARRALRVTGVPTPLPAAPHVIELSPRMNAQVGRHTGWRMTAALTGLLPGTVGRRWDGPPSNLAATVAEAAGRPLVIAVRDAHRHGWIAAAVHDLLRTRPDAMVVEMGLPHSDVPDCRTHIATYGAAAVSSLAAAEVLAGRRGDTVQPVDTGSI
ncbi:beta-N-acetylhexosaminidase [Plantactinospora sp. ZYX-F-223]|uniref:beta-N-acetylhexosaminidase n=1 Tax=Plantactinospora sp. ZYX-F-223 TaxID=3144103 RepID=UPI0031FD2707